MPLIYGEGLKAFRRLQEEIIKRNNDITIFAWEKEDHDDQQPLGIFADSPAAFTAGSNITPFDHALPEFSLTNKGLLVSSPSLLWATTKARVVGTDTPAKYIFSFGHR